MRKVRLAMTLTFAPVLSLYGQTQSNINTQTEKSIAVLSHRHDDYVVVNGAKLWFESEGSGEPLVLISGGPGFSHSFSPLLFCAGQLASGHLPGFLRAR